MPLLKIIAILIDLASRPCLLRFPVTHLGNAKWMDVCFKHLRHLFLTRQNEGKPSEQT